MIQKDEGNSQETRATAIPLKMIYDVRLSAFFFFGGFYYFNQ
jgi:hypothetical protein